MRNLVACSVIAVLLCAVAVQFGSGKEPAKKKGPSLGKLRHVVLFSFKEGTSDADVKKVEEGFGKLPSKISTVVDYEWGTNNSPEGLADGFTHCFLVTFNDDAGRAVYLPHKAHLDFVSILKPHLEKVLVIDFVSKK